MGSKTKGKASSSFILPLKAEEMEILEYIVSKIPGSSKPAVMRAIFKKYISQTASENLDKLKPEIKEIQIDKVQHRDIIRLERGTLSKIDTLLGEYNISTIRDLITSLVNNEYNKKTSTTSSYNKKVNNVFSELNHTRDKINKIVEIMTNNHKYWTHGINALTDMKEYPDLMPKYKQIFQSSIDNMKKNAITLTTTINQYLNLLEKDLIDN